MDIDTITIRFIQIALFFLFTPSSYAQTENLCLLEKVNSKPNLSNIKGFDDLVKSELAFDLIKIELSGQHEISLSSKKVSKHHKDWIFTNSRGSSVRLANEVVAKLNTLKLGDREKECHLIYTCRSQTNGYNFSSFVYLFLVKGKVIKSLVSDIPIGQINGPEESRNLSLFMYLEDVLTIIKRSAN